MPLERIAILLEQKRDALTAAINAIRASIAVDLELDEALDSMPQRGASSKRSSGMKKAWSRRKEAEEVSPDSTGADSAG